MELIESSSVQLAIFFLSGGALGRAEIQWCEQSVVAKQQRRSIQSGERRKRMQRQAFAHSCFSNLGQSAPGGNERLKESLSGSLESGSGCCWPHLIVMAFTDA